jgi:SAM-dependent methyltransferase
VSPAAYDTIGRGYSHHRRPDPRIGRQILAALGDARRVVNVGAGTGSYEPTDRTVVAVEPAATMLDQRPWGSAPAIQGVAEALPFPDSAFDAALAVLTIHHWQDLDRGLAELVRVAAGRVILAFDLAVASTLWMWRYFPAATVIDQQWTPPLDHVAERIGATRVEAVPIPHDCIDGFAGAYWRRPAAYLDPRVRAGISSLSLLGDHEIRPGLDQLAADIESGAWHEEHAALVELDELDLGYRLVIAD